MIGEEEIYRSLTDVFREVFADQALVLRRETDARHIKGWDSFAHVNIIVAAEARFGVRFRASEAQGLKNVGDFVRLIQLKRD